MVWGQQGKSRRESNLIMPYVFSGNILRMRHPIPLVQSFTIPALIPLLLCLIAAILDVVIPLCFVKYSPYHSAFHG